MANEKIELWGGMKIPIIVLSGEVNSGKTIFPLLIDPTCRLPKDSSEPTTIVFDQEGSAETYHGSLNFQWFDTRAAVFAGVHRRTIPAGTDDPKWLKILKQSADVNDSPAASMFRAWYLSLITIEPGKYRVGICDTFTPLQDGMLEWLRKHPEAFGRTSGQYEKAASMFLWPDAKAMLSHILTIDCRLRFETFVLTLHLKAKWEGDRKTKDRIAEGLDTLDKLATLHIQLDRAGEKDGKVPRVPVGILKKERLVRFGATALDDAPILPPRIENCSPDTIRQWIAAPANYAKLKASERVVVAEPTEIEVQQTRLAVAEAEADAAREKSAWVERQKELLALRQNPAQQAADQAAQAAKAAAEQREAAELAAKAQAQLAAKEAEEKRLLAGHNPSTAPAPPPEQPPRPNAATIARVDRLKALLPASGVDPVKLKAAIEAKGASRFLDMTESDQEALLVVLQKAVNARNGVDAAGQPIPY